MKIKMTQEEAKGMLKYFEHPHFTNVRNYITVLEVDPNWVKEILPPPLEMADPVVSIALSEGDQFHGLVMGVQAKFKDIVGDWGLAYVMDTDLGVVFGRESLAEPKKLGITTTDLEDDKFIGTVSRWGEEVLRIEADVIGPADQPLVGDSLDNFHFKYDINADGSGISEVDLILSHFDVKATDTVLMNPIKVELNDTPFDIYGQIPVVKPIVSFYATLDMVGTAKYLAKIPADEFLPWAFFKHDDYRLTMDLA